MIRPDFGDTAELQASLSSSSSSTTSTSSSSGSTESPSSSTSLKELIVVGGAVAVAVDANNKDDIDMKEIAIKIADCGGAHKPSHYDFGGENKLSLKDIGKDVAGDNF